MKEEKKEEDYNHHPPPRLWFGLREVNVPINRFARFCASSIWLIIMFNQIPKLLKSLISTLSPFLGLNCKLQ
jgi:hypothetical protein